eukprot:COSAG01_NODE_161_length_23642_cov_713.337000_6_plen_671_part_00
MKIVKGAGLLDQLCTCAVHANKRACAVVWIESQLNKLAAAFFMLLVFETTCAVLAWTYVDDLEEEQELKIKRKMKFSKKDMTGAWGALQSRVAQGLALGDDVQDKARHEAAQLSKTWYFEGTVLFACLISVIILGNQSRTAPPSSDLNVVMRIGEIFVTLFMSVELFIEVGISMTPAERRRLPQSPWLMNDLFVLIISWAYLVSPLRLFSIARVLRVLRPLRTLRMLSSINVVLETIVEALPLFGQACVLVSFLLIAYSLVGMSLWAGGLHYQCGVPGINATDASTYECAPCLPCAHTGDACARIEPTPYIRSENYGYTNFDSIGNAMLTFFVQMTADNGMHDLAFAIEDADLTLASIAWPLMLSGVIVLTILALNLFLAVCCSVFDDVYDKVTQRQESIVNRDDSYSSGFTRKAFGNVIDVMAHISAATNMAVSKAKMQGDEARKALASNEKVYLTFIEDVRDHDWDGQSIIAGCRNKCKNLVLSALFGHFINILICINTLALMSNRHEMPSTWMAINLVIESVCMFFFWLEFLLKWAGFGFSKYVGEQTNQLDFIVLMMTSAGWFGGAMAVLPTILGAVPGYDVLGDGLHTFSSFRLVRLLRALQMSRWVYSSPAMRGLLETVFKSWKAMVLIAVFSIFSMVMFAVVAMHLLGGGLVRRYFATPQLVD